MDVAIRDIGAFDVIFTDISEQDALKAIGASNTPKVIGAFQKALEAYRVQADRLKRYRLVDTDRGLELYDQRGRLQATVKRYKRAGGATFYQAYMRCSGESIRRADREKAIATAIDAMIAWEDGLTKFSGAEDLL